MNKTSWEEPEAKPLTLPLPGFEETGTMLQAHGWETTKEDRDLQLKIANTDTADRRWRRVSGREKPFPLQEPFKPDGVNRERRGRGNTVQESSTSCTFICGDSVVGDFTWQQWHTETLTKWKHADVHAVKSSLALGGCLMEITGLPWQSNTGPVLKYQTTKQRTHKCACSTATSTQTGGKGPEVSVRGRPLFFYCTF